MTWFESSCRTTASCLSAALTSWLRADSRLSGRRASTLSEASLTTLLAASRARAARSLLETELLLVLLAELLTTTWIPSDNEGDSVKELLLEGLKRIV